MAVYFNSEINRRSSNEDSFCDLKLRINHEASVHVMSVADGMGGLSGGKYYSRAAVRLLNEKLLHLIMDDDFRGSAIDEQTELLIEFCRGVFQEINQELYTAGLNAGVKGGTTLSLVIRFWHSYIIANCGDSPVYYMKDQVLKLASDIQNAAWHMVLEGRTEEGSVIYYQNKSRLLQYLGRRETVRPYLTVLSEEEADSILLGTDGVFGNLRQDQIARILNREKNGQEMLKELFETARDEGEEDNQTAIYYARDKGRSRVKRNSTDVSGSQTVRSGQESVPSGGRTVRPEEENVSGDRIIISGAEADAAFQQPYLAMETPEDTVVPGSYRSVSGKVSIFRHFLFKKPFGRR